MPHFLGMVGNHSRPSPSPGPVWETIQEPENTPEVSSQDELERESVLQELLPAAVQRKRKEQAVSHEASVKRPRIGISGENGFSRGRDIPSNIQITPRQHLSPGITRRVGENFASTSSEKTKLAENRYAAKNGSVGNSSIPREKATPSSTSSNYLTSHSGTSISAPHLARKRTKVAARKSASDYPRRIQPLHVSSAFTRKLKRTREEKQRQNSEDDLSDLERFFPMSPTLPPPSGQTAKGADRLANKAPISSTRGKPWVSQPLPVAKQNPVEIIDITSDGESGPPKAKLRKEENHIPRDVMEILSDDNDEPEGTSRNARVTSKGPSAPRLVIEILDSDDEPLSAPAILEEMREDEIMADVLAQRTMDDMDRLSLRGSRSPHDEPAFLPPESASEGSEIMESGDAASGSSSNSISERVPTPPQNIDVAHSAHTGMDVNEVSSAPMPVIDATLPSQKVNLPHSSVPITSSATDNVSIVPFASPSLRSNDSLEPGGSRSSPASPTRKSTCGPMQMGGLNTETSPALTSGDLPSFHFPLSPAQRARQRVARKTSVSSMENTPSQKERPLSGDMFARRKNNAFSSPSLYKEIPLPSHKWPPETPINGAIREPLSSTALRPLKRWSLGMNLADAITQASQDNNNRKLPIRTHSEADVAGEVHLEASQEAIEKSKLFLEMVQMSIPERSRVVPVKLNLPLNEGSEHQCPPDSAGQEIISSPVDLEPSVASAQIGPDFDMLEQQEMDMREVAIGPVQEEWSPPASSAAIHERRSQSSETTAEDNKMSESCDELEYIDEPEHNTVVQGIAGIDITDRGLEGTPTASGEDVLISDGHHARGIVDKIRDPELSSSTMDTLSILNGIVSTPATSPGRTYKLNSISSSIGKHGVKLDGFTIINWREFRHDIKNFTPKYCLGRDLPHTLQDYINHMSEWTRSLPDMRTVFTAAIRENTALDEPDAPPILVENTVDDEPTPPWEFHYSNQMWHGEGVPPPDVESLISCDCIGRCDPRSKTCACALRQQRALDNPNADFAYDNKGRLKEPGYPIFECNDLCGCDDDCRNRVVQHGRTCAIVIKKTEYKGWGVFADQKKIYKGTYIGIYAGELITEEEGEERGRLYNKLGRTYLFDLDFHHLRKDRDDWQSKYTVDAYHAGNFTRFLNHSCDPNCTLIPCYVNEGNIEKPLLAVFARREIETGEELCFSYSGEVDDEGDNLDGAALDDGADEKNDAVYARCHCGARNCRGRLFG